jgi:hypothetical protein
MKKVFAILLIIVLGIALGVGLAILRIRSTPWNRASDEGEPAAGASSQTGDRPGTKAARIAVKGTVPFSLRRKLGPSPVTDRADVG